MRVSCALFELKYPINLAQLHISIENDRFLLRLKVIGSLYAREHLCKLKDISSQVHF